MFTRSDGMDNVTNSLCPNIPVYFYAGSPADIMYTGKKRKTKQMMNKGKCVQCPVYFYAGSPADIVYTGSNVIHKQMNKFQRSQRLGWRKERTPVPISRILLHRITCRYYVYRTKALGNGETTAKIVIGESNREVIERQGPQRKQTMVVCLFRQRFCFEN